MIEIVPKSSVTVRDERKVDALRPAADRWQRRERDRVTQAVLLERLRYKYYVAHGTLDSVMQRLGDYGRSRRARWLMLALIYLYFLRAFWRSVP